MSQISSSRSRAVSYLALHCISCRFCYSCNGRQKQGRLHGVQNRPSKCAWNSINFKLKVCCDARDSDNKEPNRERLIWTSNHPIFHYQHSFGPSEGADVGSQGRRWRRFHFSQPGKSAIRWGPAPDVINISRSSEKAQVGKMRCQTSIKSKWLYAAAIGTAAVWGYFRARHHNRRKATATPGTSLIAYYYAPSISSSPCGITR